MGSNVLSALSMTTIAGMATMLGAVIIFFAKNENEKLLSISLGLAAGVMICISFHDLFPHSERYFHTALGTKWAMVPTVCCLLAGVLLAALLDLLVPHNTDIKGGAGEHKDLFRIGFISMLGIALHNLPEGIATFIANYQGSEIGLTVTLAIALHNIPEGVAIALPIYVASGSKMRALGCTFIGGITEPIGALLAYGLVSVIINDYILGAIFGVTAGIMLYIAIEELLPSSRQYGYPRQALIATFAGITILPLVHLIG